MSKFANFIQNYRQFTSVKKRINIVYTPFLEFTFHEGQLLGIKSKHIDSFETLHDIQNCIFNVNTIEDTKENEIGIDVCTGNTFIESYLNDDRSIISYRNNIQYERDENAIQSVVKIPIPQVNLLHVLGSEIFSRGIRSGIYLSLPKAIANTTFRAIFGPLVSCIVSPFFEIERVYKEIMKFIKKKISKRQLLRNIIIIFAAERFGWCCGFISGTILMLLFSLIFPTPFAIFASLIGTIAADSIGKVLGEICFSIVFDMLLGSDEIDTKLFIKPILKRMGSEEGYFKYNEWKEMIRKLNCNKIHEDLYKVNVLLKGRNGYEKKIKILKEKYIRPLVAKEMEKKFKESDALIMYEQEEHEYIL